VHRIRNLPLQAPVLTLVIQLLLTGYFGFHALSIQVDSSFENLLPADDPEGHYYDEIKEELGDEKIAVVGVFADDVFTPSTLAKIDTLSRKLAAIERVREVTSLTTIRGAEDTDMGLTVSKLLRKLPKTDAEAKEFRARVLANPLYVKNVASLDGTATGLTIFFDPMSDEEFRHRGIDAEIRAIVDSMGGPETYAVTGLPTINVNGAAILERDTRTFTPLAVVLVIIVLTFAFRTLRGVVIPLIPVLIGLIWTNGAMVLSGSAINLGTIVLNPLLIVIGIASGIHLISAYYHEARADRSSREIVSAVISHVATPILIAGTTTLIGFGALAFTEIKAVREFGMFSVFGIISILIGNFTVVPALLVLLPVRTVHQSEDDVGWLAEGLQKIGAFSVRHRYAVLAASAMLISISVWGITKIRVETDYLSFFHPDSVVRTENALIAERLAGTQPVAIIIEGDAPRTASRLDVLTATHDLQEFLLAQEGVDTTLSLLDLLKQMRKVLKFEGGDLPASQPEIEQLLMLLDPALLRGLVNSDSTRASVLVRTRLTGSVELGAFVEKVETFAKERFPQDVRVRVTGTAVLLAKSADDLANGQIEGIWQELLVLLTLLSLMFMSVRIGFLALIPNVVPTIALFGIMGWFGIPLNISTSMIAAIAIGIAIDDTIHLLSTFNEGLRITGSQEQAIVRAMASAGKSAFFISIALSAGFFIVCLSSFQPVMHFGLLSGVTMGIALIVELFLTPALLTTTRILTVWDLLFLKLGDDPEKQIPLFAGLRPFQAKLLVLMGTLRTASAGTAIARRGETLAEAYVLLSGEADVLRPGSTQPIRTLGRGDVVGEMGLVRQQARSADVVARGELEYLVVDERLLARMRSRYPRIGFKFLYNLTRILSDRLESTTDALAAQTPRKPD
jgi:predicted RND superfamily exporter protein